jgi:tetratricopeptide (TPR) repeat protein
MKPTRFDRLAAVVSLVALLVPHVALAGNVEESHAMAEKGAAAFKNQQFYEAAVAFEKAYQLDRRDAKNLRYAGRAWQEIGDWQRARNLLERYAEVESDAGAKASIGKYLDPLRQATPQQVLAKLIEATQKFPEAQLEEEAALQLEKVGDEASLKQSEKL